MIAASWNPSEYIALVSLIATAVVSVVALVLNHRRETELSRDAIAAERAKYYREDALGVLSAARNAASEARALAKLAKPSP